jgi:hypothetical protein
VGDVVNLNKFRKLKAKDEAGKTADTNRRLHGRTKTERTREELGQRQRDSILDGARLKKSTDEKEEE